ncbi:hypothetical protein BT93_I0262 [Corymbia citriodora subsp. variegata]|nr:hypothetical protein BT93_I0262 [Corymbia citriodora subsp. variegata]
MRGKVTSRSSRFILVIFTAITFLSYGGRVYGGITSTFIRSEWPSVDIPFDNEAFAVPKGHNAPQQVHITQGDYDGKAVIVSWVTSDAPGLSIVNFGTSPGRYTLSAEGTMTNYTFHDYKSGYIHHCLLEGLKYDTKYYYKIGEGESSREFSFQTPPKIGPDAPYKFGIIGDLGQTYNSLSTLEHYMHSGAQAVLFVGDLSYADRYQYNDVGLRWDTWGRFIEKIAAYQPWLWSAGNHEIEYMPYMGEVIPFKSYLHRYATPYLASKSSSPLWYAVRRASAHIIVLSSYSPFVKYTPQWMWLREEFKRVDREKTPWLIVLMHAPIYNSNNAHFMEGESMRSVFESWFVRNKVDVVFAGHVHAYERSYSVGRGKLWIIASCIQMLYWVIIKSDLFSTCRIKYLFLCGARILFNQPRLLGFCLSMEQDIFGFKSMGCRVGDACNLVTSHLGVVLDNYLLTKLSSKK